MRTLLTTIIASFIVAAPHAAEAATGTGTLSVTAAVVDGCAYHGGRVGITVHCTAPVPFLVEQQSQPTGSAVTGPTVFF